LARFHSWIDTPSLKLLAALIGILSLLLYLPALDYEFLNWDDESLILNNYDIHTLSPESLRWMLTAFREKCWQPAAWLFHALIYQASGGNPARHHLAGIVLHAVNTFLVTLLVFGLARAGGRKQGSASEHRRAVVMAAICGILFGTHPIHVGAVVWIGSQQVLLASLFLLLSLICYVHYVEKHMVRRPSKFWYGACLSFHGLALMTDWTAATLPLLLILLDAYPLKRKSFSLEKIKPGEKIPFFLLSAAGIAVNLTAYARGTFQSALNIPALDRRFLMAIKSLGDYTFKLLLPTRSAPLTGYPPQMEPYLFHILTWGACFLFLGIMGIIYWKKCPFFLALLGAFILILGPETGLFMPDYLAAADRHVYAGSLMFFMLVSGIMTYILFRGTAFVKLMMVVAAFLYVTFLSYSTIKNCGQVYLHWKLSGVHNKLWLTAFE